MPTRSAPAAFNDQDSLEIARRIEREAGSTYRINGREVRARDVQILFADASTGARSPALVHQGRIGEIIQAKPEQRRRVLEEAAGVAGLHARRHEAELRLKAAETNLLRVEDVIGQLAGQIDGLKKQARQAIRYRTVSAQVRKAEATLYHLRWTAANAEVTEAERAKDSACARSPSAPARKPRPPSGRRSPPPRCRRCAKPRRAPARRCTGSMSRCRISTAKKRAPRTASPNSICGLCNLPPTASASSASPPTPKQAIARLAAEEETIRAEARESAGRRSGIDARVAEADAELSAAEKIFADLTTALADLTAQRNQFRKCRARASERIAQAFGRNRRRSSVNWRRCTAPTVAPLAAAVEGTQAALTEAEAAAIAAEAAHNAARAELEAARERARRSRKSACSAWRPRPRRFPRCCRSRPAASGRR